MKNKILRKVSFLVLAITLAVVAVQAQMNEPNFETAKLIASDGVQGEDFFGYSVSISGDTAIAGAYGDDNDNGSDAGSAYVFVGDTGFWTEQAKLTASDGAVTDLFGYSVSISGDTAIVGALYDDNDNGSDAGSAYIFVRNTGGWTQQAKLTASDGAASDLFGTSVSISGDTAIVGALYDINDNGGRAGSAYVFVRDTGGWTQQAKLTASDGAAWDYFSWSVSISGDTAIVGAYGDDNDNGSYAGSAYVFVRDTGGWTQQAKLTASDGAVYHYFGKSVSISGDTVIVGAYGDENENGSYAGSAYVFVGDTGGWTEQAKLTASDGAAGDLFGWSVAISGDTAIVGAYGDDNDNGSNVGSAYVFVRDTGGWTEQAKLTASDGARNDQFGLSAAISGDTAIVAAYGSDGNSVHAGSAYIFTILPPGSPKAKAGPDQAIRSGDIVNLDGSASFDDNTASEDLVYAWSFVYKPAGSTATLSSADTETPSFIPDLAGDYVIQLTVTDEEGLSSSPDVVVVSSSNLAPTADAGNYQVVIVNTMVNLNGLGSTDPEGDPLTYSWTIATKPDGSTATLSDPAAVKPSFDADLEGIYHVTLDVSDFIGPGTPDTVQIIATTAEGIPEATIVTVDNIVTVLDSVEVTTAGNQNALLNFLSQAMIALQNDDLAEAINKLEKAIARTDGCVLRGSPDGNGPGRDWITDCTVQTEVYELLNDALQAITP